MATYSSTLARRIPWREEPVRLQSMGSQRVRHDGATSLHFDCVDHNKLQKILQEMGMPDHLICFLRNLYAGQEATVDLDMEQQTGSKSGKEYVKAVTLLL